MVWNHVTRLKRLAICGLTFMLGLLLSLGWHALVFRAQAQTSSTVTEPHHFMQQGYDRYQAGQYNDAIAPFQTAIQSYTLHNDSLNVALASSYLALVYQEIGDRPLAEASIHRSVDHLSPDPSHDDEYAVQAQVLSIWGELQFVWGQLESAAHSWQMASAAYDILDDQAGLWGIEINQIQVLRSLGRYRQVDRRISKLMVQLEQGSDSSVESASSIALTAWRSFGTMQYTMGHYGQAKHAFEESLKIAQHLDMRFDRAAALFSLGNVERAEGDRQFNQYRFDVGESRSQVLFCPSDQIKRWLENDFHEGDRNPYQQAAHYYREAALVAGNTDLNMRSRLNLFSLVIALEPEMARETLPALIADLEQLPPSRFSVYAHIHLAQTLECLPQSVDAFVDAWSDSFPDRLSMSNRFSISNRPLGPNNRSIEQQVAILLQTAIDIAETLGDVRAESYAWGNLGQFYEAQQLPTDVLNLRDRLTRSALFSIFSTMSRTGGSWDNQHGLGKKSMNEYAQTVTQKALRLAEQLQAPDLAYRWQWQLGRLLQRDAQREAAIAYYSQAFDNLQRLRSDLMSLDPEIQFSFREQVEPLYRQFISLLLRPSDSTDDLTDHSDDSKEHSTRSETFLDPSPIHLKRARDVLEALQLVELDNFFRDACSTVKSQSLDDLIDAQETDVQETQNSQNPSSAVLYAIMLGDRLDLVLKLPRKPSSPSNLNETRFVEQHLLQTTDDAQLNLHYYSTPVSDREVRQTVLNVRRNMIQSRGRGVQQPAHQLYQWLVQPVEAQLQEYGIDHLVFVLDGVLRNVAIAALYDGENYLGDRYQVSLAPGLQLLETPKASNGVQQQSQMLAAGLSEGRFGFSPLPNVEIELATLTSIVPTATQLLNQDFTEARFEDALQSELTSVIHFATHGQFGSQSETTFLLAYDDKITVNELYDLLHTQRPDQPNQFIDLLVLSACQTASGDERAALGLAGMAVRAGARSTLASLWSVDDEATALLMTAFYHYLYQSDPPITKVGALQLAQQSVKNFERGGDHPFEHPQYWAAFVLLGNWR